MSTVAASQRLTAVAAAIAALTLTIGAPAVAAQPFNPGGSRRVADSTDPTTASLQLSQAAFADGEAAFVVLGRNDVFADNLAGAGLAGAIGPLLLIDPAPAEISQVVVDEITRVRPPVGTPGDPASQCDGFLPDVYVLGGPAAVSPQVVASLEADGHCVKRLGGASRVETAVAVADEILVEFVQISPEQTNRGTILIARDDNPADSAAGGAYASFYGVPIVVTPGDALHPAVRDLLTPGDTAFNRVVLLGGQGALSAAVQNDIEAAVTGFDTMVERVAGATRDDTAVRIATDLFEAPRPANAAIANGFGDDFWVYALPGGVIAARGDAPLLYVNTDRVPATTTGQYLCTAVSGDLITIGPESRISAPTQSAAEAAVAGTCP